MIMDAPTAEARIARIFETALKLEVPSADADLFETGAVDSLGFVELLLHLEREFGIKISLEDLELDHFRTIQRIAQFVLDQDGRVGGAAMVPNGDRPPGRM